MRFTRTASDLSTGLTGIFVCSRVEASLGYGQTSSDLFFPNVLWVAGSGFIRFNPANKKHALKRAFCFIPCDKTPNISILTFKNLMVKYESGDNSDSAFCHNSSYFFSGARSSAFGDKLLISLKKL